MGEGEEVGGLNAISRSRSKPLVVRFWGSNRSIFMKSRFNSVKRGRQAANFSYSVSQWPGACIADKCVPTGFTFPWSCVLTAHCSLPLPPLISILDKHTGFSAGQTATKIPFMYSFSGKLIARAQSQFPHSCV
jgi:hypothetical protein